MTKKALEKHWETDCRAFFFFCPTCGIQFKRGTHNCKQLLQEEKKTLQYELILLKDDLDDLKDQIAMMDKQGMKAIENSGGETWARLNEYYNDFYKYLTTSDKADDFKTLEKIMPDDGPRKKGGKQSMY